jgi:hypothetical protein
MEEMLNEAIVVQFKVQPNIHLERVRKKPWKKNTVRAGGLLAKIQTYESTETVLI